jgi:hypothetical protein
MSGLAMVRIASGPSKRLHQSLKPPGRAVEPLACIDYFDFNDTALAPDGMHADRTNIDTPRRY